MTLVCDGCSRPVLVAEILFAFVPDRPPVRYCRDCHEVWEAWMRAVQAENERLSRLHDLFIEQSRMQVPLLVVPQDLPTVLVRTGGSDGGNNLRLG